MRSPAPETRHAPAFRGAQRRRRMKEAAAGDGRDRRNRLEVLPPVMLLAALIVMGGLRLFAPGAALIAFPLNLTGLLAVAAGVALSFSGSSLFERRGTTVMTFDEPCQLVTDGPFRFSRNPMYLGFMVFLTGWAVVMGTLSPFLVLPVFFVITDLWYVRVEERAMRRRFGEAYEAYCRRTRRWI